jgi:hypothetical protein
LLQIAGWGAPLDTMQFCILERAMIAKLIDDVIAFLGSCYPWASISSIVADAQAAAETARNAANESVDNKDLQNAANKAESAASDAASVARTSGDESLMVSSSTWAKLSMIHGRLYQEANKRPSSMDFSPVRALLSTMGATLRAVGAFTESNPNGDINRRLGIMMNIVPVSSELSTLLTGVPTGIQASESGVIGDIDGTLEALEAYAGAEIAGLLRLMASSLPSKSSIEDRLRWWGVVLEAYGAEIGGMLRLMSASSLPPECSNEDRLVMVGCMAMTSRCMACLERIPILRRLGTGRARLRRALEALVVDEAKPRAENVTKTLQKVVYVRGM